MRARVGDLAIVRFDPCEYNKQRGEKWNEYVGLITGSREGAYLRSREYKFIYWSKMGGKTEVCEGRLPPGRLVRARPKSGKWDGELKTLSLDDVEPCFLE